MPRFKTFPLVVVLSMLGAVPARPFHDGGVAECAGCHTMHNSQNGTLVDASHPNGNAYLLNAGTPSDTCLRCHAADGQFKQGSGFGPGGDFYWVTRTFSWSAHGSTATSTGDSHGHNVIAPAYGIAQDATLSMAPGGTFLSSRLGCTSCHDPHGNRNFRLLYGSDRGPHYGGLNYTFTADAPLAKGNGRKTDTPDGNETNAHHTIYKSGMSEWCANCHTNLHANNTTNFVHQTGGMSSAIAGNYNAYVSTNGQRGGSLAVSYLGLVPFEAINVDLATANPANYTQGPAGNDQVMCLSCHRAHASPFSDAARWDLGETFLADSHPAITDINFVQTDVDRKYYGYTLVRNQRSLCNKCHVKDYDDKPVFTRRPSLPDGPWPHNSVGE